MLYLSFFSHQIAIKQSIILFLVWSTLEGFLLVTIACIVELSLGETQKCIQEKSLIFWFLSGLLTETYKIPLDTANSL